MNTSGIVLVTALAAIIAFVAETMAATLFRAISTAIAGS